MSQRNLLYLSAGKRKGFFNCVGSASFPKIWLTLAQQRLALTTCMARGGRQIVTGPRCYNTRS